MEAEKKVTIRVRPSGWLVSYFDKDQLLIRTRKDIETAMVEIRKAAWSQAQSSIPEGGMLILINGKNMAQQVGITNLAYLISGVQKHG